MAKKKLKVALIFGGTSQEREVSLVSAKSVYKNLDKNKYAIEKIEVTPKRDWLHKSLNKLLHSDVAFLVVHGPGGEDGTIQGLLELLNIPYTFSKGISAGLTMDKSFTNSLVGNLGIKIPKTQVLVSGEKLNTKDFPEKLVVKPNAMGSSFGVSITNKKTISTAIKFAFKYDSKILIQEFIKGREITVSVLGNKHPRAFPVAEIVSNTGKGYWDYVAKYEEGGADHLIPAPLTKAQTKQAQALAVKIHKSLGCGGATRTDFIMTPNGQFYFLEINTIPGMTKFSLVPQCAASVGISYSQLLDKLIHLALEKE